MVVRAGNSAELGRRGANLDNAEYVFLRCRACGRFALYDLEVMMIYFDANDLRAKKLYGFAGADPVACPSCGNLDSFDDADESDLDTISKSEWAFAVG
jgi:hypothetical protein